MKNTDNFDISVIVPVFNVEEYLSECLESIIRQGKVNTEIIIVDDGSTDLSGYIADEFAEKYKNAVVFHNENKGLGYGRNFGVKYAHGKYIYFMDSDDMLTDNTLYNMFAIAEKNNSEMVICNVARFNTNKKWASPLHKKAFTNINYNVNIIDNGKLLYDTTSWNKLILRSFYIENGFAFPENILYEDIPVTTPLHFLAKNVTVYNEVGYLWRFRDGVTKSITQNTNDLKNLYDRIKIMEMLDGFFQKHIQDNQIILQKQIKYLDTDLNIFINACRDVNDEPALEIMKAINNYIDNSISEKAFDNIPVLLKQKYEYVRQYNIKALKKLLNYEKDDYGDCIINEKDGRLIASYNDELFTLADRDITKEVQGYPVLTYIDSLEKSKEKCTIHGHLYKKRISVSNNGFHTIKAYLFGIVTNEKYELDVQYEKKPDLTERFGYIAGNNSEKVMQYNYDDAGFKITISIEELLKLNPVEGKYKILLEYNDKYYNGNTILSGASNKTLEYENESLCLDDSLLKINFNPIEEISFTLSKEIAFITGIEKVGDDIGYSLSIDAAGLFAKSDNGNIVDFTKKGNNYICPVKALPLNEEYSLFTKVDLTSEPKRVYSYSTSIKIIECGSINVINSSMKTREFSIMAHNNMFLVNSFSQEDSKLTIGIKVFSDSARALFSSTEALLFVNDNITEMPVILAKAEPRITEKGNIACKFKIDFAKKSVNKNLYESTRNVYVKFKENDKVLSVNELFSENAFYCSIKIDTLKIVAKRSKFGNVYFEFLQKWQAFEDTKQKRKETVRIKYPEFLREEINPKLIIFESMWGAKYSCNPRAIYEYINSNYPEYECVWAFNDMRMPINGKAKRVRRLSEEYFHYLATAKYLINNVNFPDEFIKRDGQIMVQTMHGTPLKTFGLEITQEIDTDDKREAFLKRVSAWNYLVVQGQFMKSKAFDCFEYDKKILKTGYPRTDSLYTMDDERKNEIRRQLGLPLDKKIIFYAPTWRIRKRFDMKLDIEQMRKKLSDEYVLMIRIHYFSSDGYTIPSDNEFVFDVNKYSSVEDLYQISDLLITDYSSVMFDYALLDKPMLFFTYDYDEYCNDLRGIYVDFKKEAPGPLLYTSDEVISAIINLDKEMNKCRERTELFKKKYLTYENANSSKAVFDTVFRQSGTELLGEMVKKVPKKMKNILKYFEQ